MSLSKSVSNECDSVDLKVHFTYHGLERCCLVDTTFNKIYGMDYAAFVSFLKDEVPQLLRLNELRISFMDDEGTYVDINSRNYHLSTTCFKSDVPKINVKVYEGASPVPDKSHGAGRCETSFGLGSRKRIENLFDPVEYQRDVSYRSPLQLEIDNKDTEVKLKEKELLMFQHKYEELWREFNPPVYQDSSKAVCTRCHLRLGHTKNRCHMSECTSAKICGLVDRHASEKKTLQDLGKRKQKVDGELVALKSELHVKKSISDGIEQSFESKLHDILIRSNPEKYLTINRRPKEGVILADSCIIKKYYGSKRDAMPDTGTRSHTFKVGFRVQHLYLDEWVSHKKNSYTSTLILVC